MIKEIWKDIPEYEGLYQVSNLGRVRSLGVKFHPGKILKLTNVGGYLRAELSKNKMSKRFMVHRLMAIAFLPNPDNLPEINHKDCNPQNNFVWVNDDGTIDPEKSNIEWCTRAYNNSYKDRGKKTGIALTNRPDKSKPVRRISDGSEFVSQREAMRQTGTSIWKISADCLGITKRNPIEWEFI